MSAETGMPLLYVLSAGRTGTMFLERLLLTYCDDVIAGHEPKPSRLLLFLGNLRNDTGLLSGAVERLAELHRARLHDGPKPFVEINPFLCPITDLLPQQGRPLRVLHMVRSPGDWAKSIMTFKASDRYRALVDWVPFAKPYPAPRPAGWSGLSEFEKALHRWTWCNARIRALQSEADRYAVVRSEDVFSGDENRRDRAVQSIFETLGLDPPNRIDPEFMNQKVNPAPASKEWQDTGAIRRICGELAETLGYNV